MFDVSVMSVQELQELHCQAPSSSLGNRSPCGKAIASLRVALIKPLKVALVKGRLRAHSSLPCRAPGAADPAGGWGRAGLGGQDW